VLNDYDNLMFFTDIIYEITNTVRMIKKINNILDVHFEPLAVKLLT